MLSGSLKKQFILCLRDHMNLRLCGLNLGPLAWSSLSGLEKVMCCHYILGWELVRLNTVTALFKLGLSITLILLSEGLHYESQEDFDVPILIRIQKFVKSSVIHILSQLFEIWSWSYLGADNIKILKWAFWYSWMQP